MVLSICGSVLMCEVQSACLSTEGFNTHGTSFNTFNAIMPTRVLSD